MVVLIVHNVGVHAMSVLFKFVPVDKPVDSKGRTKEFFPEVLRTRAQCDGGHDDIRNYDQANN